MQLCINIKRRIQYSKYSKRKIFISTGANVSGTEFENIGYNNIENGSMIIDCEIGRGTYIRNGCLFKKTKIGRYCSVAPGVKVVYGEHPPSEYVAIHPSFYKNRSIAGLSFGHESGFQEYKETKSGYYCEIGNDVWIGTDVKLMAGIAVGNGSIIAAGSIVTKDVPDYAIVAGVPGRIIKYRFSKDEIAKLNESHWWDRDIDWIKMNVHHFDKVENFISLLDVEQYEK